jgi:hypothetical protein
VAGGPGFDFQLVHPGEMPEAQARGGFAGLTPAHTSFHRWPQGVVAAVEANRDIRVEETAFVSLPDFKVRICLGLDIQGRRDQVNTLADPHRAAGEPRTKIPPGCSRPATVASPERPPLTCCREPAFGCLFDQRDDIRSGDGYDIRHTTPPRFHYDVMKR